MTSTSTREGQPVRDAVTDRVLDLLAQAQDTLRQARYEADHVQRDNPAPAYGSPWATPDAPPVVRRQIDAALAEVDRLLAVANVVRRGQEG